MKSILYIDDDTFTNMFANVEFSLTDNKKVKYILNKLEDDIYGDQNNDVSNLSIEHVLPKTENDNWNVDINYINENAFKPGNLYLLEKD